MKRHYCTYFDQAYLVRGLALIDSLREHSEGDWQLFIVCMDDISRDLMESFAIPEVTVSSLSEIEKVDPELAATRGTRTHVEYLWTTTPAIILWLIKMNPEIEILTYLDADLWFYSSPEPMFAELEGNSVLIHAHRYTPELRDMEVNGKYNVGLVCFRADANGLAALQWWRTRCIESCELDIKTGKCGDQMYLNDWPERFEGVRVLQHLGVGVAPWNVDQYDLTKEHGRVLVNGEPLIFFHFHSFGILGHGRYRLAYRFYIKPAAVRLIYQPYTEALTRHLAGLAKASPPFQPKFPRPTRVERGFDLLFKSRLASNSITRVRKTLRRLSAASA